MNIYNHQNQFLDNKYTQWYYSIINQALSQNRESLKKDNIHYVYYEKHHTLPNAIFPEYSDLQINPWNAVLLTAREHFIVHLLLVKMTLGVSKQKMSWALNMMFTTRSNLRNKCSIVYAKNKENLRHTEEAKLKTTGSNNGFYGKTHSEEFKKKMSLLKGGISLSDEHKNKIKQNNAKTNLGKPLSEVTKEKLRIKAKKRYENKENHPNLGKTLSTETKDKIRLKATGRKASEESKKTRSIRCSGARNHRYGSHFMWINDGVKNKRHDPHDEIPANFVKGKIQKSRIKPATT